MGNGNAALISAASLLCAMLAGCGDGGASSATAQIPPAPSGPTYTKIAEMIGDRTFQTGGVQYNTGPGGFSNGSNLAFPNGVRVAYAAASDTYTLTAPDNTVASFGPADVQPQTNPATLQWLKRNSSNVVTDQFTLIVPTNSAGVALSYMVIGTWGAGLNTSSPTYRIAVGGSPTVASDMPKTGTANYAVGVGGAANLNGSPYTLSGSSSGSFSANFAAGTVSTTLTLGGTQQTGGTVTSFGIFNGNGTIASNSPGFTGTISGTASNGTAATGGFSGAFFGPAALEAGFGYTISAGTFSAVGGVTGIKQ